MNNIILSHEEKKKSYWWLITLIFSLVLLSFSYQEWGGSSVPQVNQTELTSQQESILEQDDAINTGWLRTLNPLVKNVEGRVVWSSFLQKGVMEFFDLPKIKANQSYQLWIYDLAEKNSKPILSTAFSEVNSNLMLVPFTTEKVISSPFKFELLLKTEGQESSQPLFLAQP